MARVVLAMSGGVDSSVAAHLLLEQGHEVIGVFMRHGVESPVACEARGASSEARVGEEKSPDNPRLAPRASRPAPLDPRLAPRASKLPILHRLDHKQGCCTASDAEDARRVADRLSIPFYALNLDAEFSRIVDYFVDEYSAGRTPNPCVQCNNWIKFGKLFEYADSVGAEFVATGHYAKIGMRREARGASRRVQGASRVVPDPGAPTIELAKPQAALLRGRDAAKDQSYVLFGVKREYLERMMLPVGDFEKPAIRALAARLGLNVAAKKDSQEICFVTRGRYDEFVRSYRGSPDSDRGGELVLTDGTVVGQHRGIEGFTVGQRKNLGVALGAPKFVVRIEPQTRRVVLGDRPELGRSELVAANCNWLTDPPAVSAASSATSWRGCQVQIRYNAAAAPAEISWDGARLAVRFAEPQFGVAPGQAAVVYDGPRVLGGGWIV